MFLSVKQVSVTFILRDSLMRSRGYLRPLDITDTFACHWVPLYFNSEFFSQQKPRSAQQARPRKEPRGRREVPRPKSPVYPRHLPQWGQEVVQEQALQHRPAMRRVLRGSLKKPLGGTSYESPWRVRTCCRSSRVKEQDCQTTKLLKRLRLLWESYNQNRRP